MVNIKENKKAEKAEQKEGRKAAKTAEKESRMASMVVMKQLAVVIADYIALNGKSDEYDTFIAGINDRLSAANAAIISRIESIKNTEINSISQAVELQATLSGLYTAMCMTESIQNDIDNLSVNDFSNDSPVVSMIESNLSRIESLFA